MNSVGSSRKRYQKKARVVDTKAQDVGGAEGKKEMSENTFHSSPDPPHEYGRIFSATA
jgi:hypothetical protein